LLDVGLSTPSRQVAKVASSTFDLETELAALIVTL